MTEPCKICGAKEEPKIGEDDKSIVGIMFDTLTEEADEEGPGVLEDIELGFICGEVCNKCYLECKKVKHKEGRTPKTKPATAPYVIAYRQELI